MENKWTAVSILVLSVSVLFSSYYLGNILKAERQNYDVSSKVIQTGNVNDDLLTVKEAASFLDLSETQLQQLITNDKLYGDDLGIPYYSINNQLRFSKKALSEWLVTISKVKLKI